MWFENAFQKAPVQQRRSFRRSVTIARRLPLWPGSVFPFRLLGLRLRFGGIRCLVANQNCSDSAVNFPGLYAFQGKFAKATALKFDFGEWNQPEIWPQRPRYSAVTMVMHCAGGGGTSMGWEKQVTGATHLWGLTSQGDNTSVGWGVTSQRRG